MKVRARRRGRFAAKRRFVSSACLRPYVPIRNPLLTSDGTMTATSLATVTAWSYGLALVFYAGLAVRMALGWRRSSRAVALIFAVLSTAAWAAACISFATAPSVMTLLAASAADMLRYIGWFAFVLIVLTSAGGSARVDATAAIPRWAVWGMFAAPVAAFLLSDAFTLKMMLGWS